MLDPKLLRTDLENTAKQLARRGFVLDVLSITSLEEKRKQVQVLTQQYQNERNTKSKAIGQAKARGEDTKPLMDEVASIATALKQAEADLEKLQNDLTAITLGIPNIPHASVPDGKDERDNQEVRRWGEPKKLEFAPKDHVDLGTDLGLMDFEVAAKISGARFVVLQGRARATAPCAHPVHARPAHAGTWLHRNLCPVPGKRGQPAWYRPVAQVRGRAVCECAASRASI